MTMQIHDVSLEVLRTLTLVRHIGADEAPARKRLRKICDISFPLRLDDWRRRSLLSGSRCVEYHIEIIE